MTITLRTYAITVLILLCVDSSLIICAVNQTEIKGCKERINSYNAFPCARLGQYCFRITKPRIVTENLF